MQGDGQQHRLTTRPVAEAKLQTLLTRTRTRIKVFVAGPYLNPSWAESDIASKTPGTRLRYHLRRYVEDCGFDVILGEHRGVAEITTDTVPTAGNIAASELALVNDAHAVIIIPDSPGSFCEAGAWSMMEHVCRKSLVLPNGIYESQAGYLQDALLPQLEGDYARVRWVDYEDRDSVIEIVDQFLGEMVDRTVIRSLKSG